MSTVNSIGDVVAFVPWSADKCQKEHMREVVLVVLDLSLEGERVVRHRERDIHLLDVPVGGDGHIERVLSRSG